MDSFLKIYRRLNYFLTLLLLFAAAGAVLLITVPKGELELWINNHHTKFADVFFLYATYIGDGWTYFVFIFLLLFAKRKYFIMAAASGIASTIVTNLLKQFVFYGAERPVNYFQGKATLYLIEGAPVLHSASFPSGHSLSVFSMFCVLSFIVKNKNWQWLFFTLSLLAGISRIYLLAHFKEDVYAGAIIGTLTSVLIIFFFEKWFAGKPLMDEPLYRLGKQK